MEFTVPTNAEIAEDLCMCDLRSRADKLLGMPLDFPRVKEKGETQLGIINKHGIYMVIKI